MTAYETEDGWNLDNICPLGEASNAIADLDRLDYELKNCVRTKGLQEMRDELIEAAQSIIDSVEVIEDEDNLVEAE